MTGTSQHTGQLGQARTSYLSTEVVWGYRFTNIINYDRERQKYITSIDKLDKLEQTDTALCSAKRHVEVLHELNNYYLAKEMANSCSFVNQTIEEDENDSDDSSGGIHMG